MRRSQTICISGELMHQQWDCDFGRAGGEIEPRLRSNPESFALRIAGVVEAIIIDPEHFADPCSGFVWRGC
jgi:hypothetical protein